MNQYVEAFDKVMAKIERAAREEDDPNRSDILWNYLHHAAYEVSGNWEHIFTPEMTIEEPHYEVQIATEETMVLDGEDAVKGFYAALEDVLVLNIDSGDHQLWVNDWGLAEIGTHIQFLPGQAILDDGLEKRYYRDAEIDEADETYMLSCPYAMFWPYDDDARLVGEQIHQLEPFDISKPDPADIPAEEDIVSVCEEYLPE